MVVVTKQCDILAVQVDRRQLNVVLFVCSCHAKIKFAITAHACIVKYEVQGGKIGFHVNFYIYLSKFTISNNMIGA